jgi:septum formation protein
MGIIVVNENYCTDATFLKSIKNIKNMLINQLEKYKIFLASSSPRRHQLLAGMDIVFEYLPLKVEEKYPEHFTPVEVAEYLSQLKLSPVIMENYPDNAIFIACDTIVVVEGSIIGKPKNEEDAIAILHRLSGREHTVITGVTVATLSKKITSHKTTKVKFKTLSDEEIKYYIGKYKPFDKAGAYGIQEWIGYVGIEYVEGSFYNIMGLPTRLLWEMLEQIENSQS